MKNLVEHFKNKKFLISTLSAVVLFLISLAINFYAGAYATEHASNSVTDLILNNIPVFDVDGMFVYGPLVMWLFVALLCFREPKLIPFLLKSLALFILIRSFFITLTHIGPFPDQLPIRTPIYRFPRIISMFSSGGDLFFSAHTGLPFLLALIFWDKKYLRYLFIAAAMFFGAIVLMAHAHYSIDVLSAFFITYAIFHIAEIIFAKEKKIFIGGLDA